MSTLVLNPDDMVRVTLIDNVPGKEGEPITIGWNSRQYVLKPGKEMIVPLNAAINWFGDPRSKENVQAVKYLGPDSDERLFIADRAAEVRRLRTLYAIRYGDGFTDIEGTRLVPKVSLATLENEPITTVLDDPLGETVSPSDVPTVAEATDQKLMIEHLQHQINELNKHLEGQTPKDLAEIPQDRNTDTEKQSPFADLDNAVILDELPEG